eukprot:GHVN01009502.1.p1 GENE.GHVN01009502.1~~GHVN01009502.1.p1  ORF type:complete len:648 (-),score=164.97 GHVN01009502.1:362-2203(-)
MPTSLSDSLANSPDPHSSAHHMILHHSALYQWKLVSGGQCPQSPCPMWWGTPGTGTVEDDEENRQSHCDFDHLKHRVCMGRRVDVNDDTYADPFNILTGYHRRCGVTGLPWCACPVARMKGKRWGEGARRPVRQGKSTRWSEVPAGTSTGTKGDDEAADIAALSEECMSNMVDNERRRWLKTRQRQEQIEKWREGWGSSESGEAMTRSEHHMGWESERGLRFHLIDERPQGGSIPVGEGGGQGVTYVGGETTTKMCSLCSKPRTYFLIPLNRPNMGHSVSAESSSYVGDDGASSHVIDTPFCFECIKQRVVFQSPVSSSEGSQLEQFRMSRVNGRRQGNDENEGMREAASSAPNISPVTNITAQVLISPVPPSSPINLNQPHSRQPSPSTSPSPHSSSAPLLASSSSLVPIRSPPGVSEVDRSTQGLTEGEVVRQERHVLSQSAHSPQARGRSCPGVERDGEGAVSGEWGVGKSPVGAVAQCHIKKCKQPKQLQDMLICCRCERGFHAHCCIPPLSYMLVTRFPWSCNDDKVCTKCELNTQEDAMLICDGCDRAFHKWCLTPELKEIPEGHWFCRDCGVCTRCNNNLTQAEVMDARCFSDAMARLCTACVNNQ